MYCSILFYPELFNYYFTLAKELNAKMEATEVIKTWYVLRVSSFLEELQHPIDGGMGSSLARLTVLPSCTSC